MKATREKCYALILAGGLGNRMGDCINIPKQFYKLTDKPLLIHTLETFENHPEIDAICVVCLEGWESYLRGCLDCFNIRKVLSVVPGGNVRHKSVHNGLRELAKAATSNDIIIVHDGVRPFIRPNIITQGINAVRAHGSAMASIRSSDSLVMSGDSMESNSALNRDSVFLVQTPQCYHFGRGLAAYQEAEGKGITNSINCCELFVALGQTVHLIPGLKTNIKLTTAEDIDFLHALHAIYNNEEKPAP